MRSDSSRRDFFQTGLAGAAGLAAAQVPAFAQSPQSARTLPPPPPVNGPIKLGVASYSLREFQRGYAINATRNILRTPYISVKEMHLWSWAPDAEIARGRADFAKAGLITTGCGTITFQKDDDADIRFWFEYAKKGGFPMIVAAPTQQTLPRVEKFAREYNIKVAIHNHGTEDKYFPAPQDAYKLIKDMDPRMGLCVDIGHTTRTGVDIVQTIRECAPRIMDIHVKDLRNLMDKDSQCDVGDGAMPIPAIFAELVKIKYPGCVMLEYEINASDPVPGMMRSFAYMRGVIAAMGLST